MKIKIYINETKIKWKNKWKQIKIKIKIKWKINEIKYKQIKSIQNQFIRGPAINKGWTKSTT